MARSLTRTIDLPEIEVETATTEKKKKNRQLTLVNIILVFRRKIDRNVQLFVNKRFGDHVWTYLCITSKVLNRIRSKNIMRELFSALYIFIVNVK